MGEKVASKRFVLSYQYTDLKEFYAMNPDCCFLIDEDNYDLAGGYAIPLRKKLKGSLNPPFLRIDYIAAFDEQNNNMPIYIEMYYGFSNCGRLHTNPDNDDFFNDWIYD